MKDETMERILHYGWVSLVAVILGAAIFATVQDEHEWQSTPSDFNLSESQQVVSNALPGDCVNTRNNTLGNQYHFECSQDQGNYTYVGKATVEYNATGNDRVILFD